TVNDHPIHRWDDATEVLRSSAGKVITVTVRRNGNLVTLHPRLADHNPSFPSGNHVGFLGIGSYIVTHHYGPISAISTAGKDVGQGMWLSIQALGKLFAPSSIHRLLQEAAGNRPRSAGDPSTVVGVTGQAGGLLGSGNFAGFLGLIASFNI